MLALIKASAAPGNMALTEMAEPEPGPNEVLIDIAASGICGSDLHLYHGTLRGIPLKYPLLMGHEYSGTIRAVGADVQGWHVGDRVTAEPSAGCGHCRYCQQGYTNVCTNRRGIAGSFTSQIAVKACYLHRLPKSLDLITATLCEPLACVVHGVLEESHVTAGDLCVVIGPGPLGLLTALVAQTQGAQVVMLGRESSRVRLELAKELGVEHVANISRQDPLELIRQLTDGYGADVVFGCAGTAAAVELGLELVKRRGSYTELALFGTDISIDFEKVLLKEVRVTGAVSQRSPSWQRMLRLIETGTLATDKLSRIVTGLYPLTAWQEGFRRADDKLDAKVVLVPT